MSLPPRHVYSGTVTNNASYGVHLTVEWDMPAGAAKEEASFFLKPGEAVDLEQKTVNAPEGGSYTMTGHISGVHANPEEKKAAPSGWLLAPFNVASPTKDYKWTVVEEGGKCEIREQ